MENEHTKSRFPNLVIVATILSMLGTAGGVSITPVSDVKAAVPAMPAAPDGKSRRLEGTWEVQVTLQNCQTGAALRTSPAFLTFAQGGTLVETTTVFSSAQRSPGHGFLEHTGGRTFKAVSKAFIFSPVVRRACTVWAGGAVPRKPAASIYPGLPCRRFSTPLVGDSLPLTRLQSYQPGGLCDQSRAPRIILPWRFARAYP